MGSGLLGLAVHAREFYLPDARVEDSRGVPRRGGGGPSDTARFQAWRAGVGFDAAQWAHSSTDDLTAFFDRVDYPLYVVTVRSPAGEMSGCLAGFVTQCSIGPPNFLVCVSKANHSLDVAERSSGMGLHLLGVDQADLARLFAEETGDLVDKFAVGRLATRLHRGTSARRHGGEHGGRDPRPLLRGRRRGLPDAGGPLGGGRRELSVENLAKEVMVEG